jgi:2'-5' RNA ligase
MADIRSFICFEIPEEILFRLKNVQDRLRPHSRGVRWVRSEGIHLTLKFLGDVAENRLPDIARAVQIAVQNIEPFDISLSGFGAFPDFRRPRVFWVGIREKAGILARMQHRIEEELEKGGFPAEKRPFTPHLTLGRVKFQDNIEAVSRILSGENIGVAEFRAREVVIKKSELQPSGALYTSLYNIEL